MHPLRATLAAATALGCGACAHWTESFGPATSLQLPTSAHSVHRIDRTDLSEQALLDAVLRVVEGMQYRVESHDRELGLVIATGGKVTYNPALVAAGTAIINGAIIVAQTLGGGSAAVGVELDASHEFRLYVQVWRHPDDTRPQVRAFFIRTTQKSLGGVRRETEVDPGQYEAFFTLLDAEVGRASEVHQ